ncbi:hypothetical protein GBA52_024717 [Prunus armeniaca]|nr:hypothetical protein GBA52_024717 [Prunus armeniaca]
MARYYPRLFCGEIILQGWPRFLMWSVLMRLIKLLSNSLLTCRCVFQDEHNILWLGCLKVVCMELPPTIVRAPLVVMHMPSSWASPQRYWQPLQAHVVVAPMILHR